ncbi:MAG: hypothetical protein JO147_09525, partial [Actinobacteria bacterium]|nr:hypothetical protein [Actinomycetota bacterium]
MAEIDLDDIREYVTDWSTHLRSINRATSTISSYLTCAKEFIAFLLATGRSTIAQNVTRG